MVDFPVVEYSHYKDCVVDFIDISDMIENNEY